MAGGQYSGSRQAPVFIGYLDETSPASVAAELNYQSRLLEAALELTALNDHPEAQAAIDTARNQMAGMRDAAEANAAANQPPLEAPRPTVGDEEEYRPEAPVDTEIDQEALKNGLKKVQQGVNNLLRVPPSRLVKNIRNGTAVPVSHFSGSWPPRNRPN
ncbi:hypothetical protein [Calycomorphotria hydatis]|uniref:hypothetical protein n=1 Tax=Calycomorphotria hydatis TaxID=2528027 RepID=UPI0011A3BA2C|nr:hypothetical protein [Calycomorphotria hydatis]